MNSQHLVGVAIGGLAVLVGAAWVLGAVRRVRDHSLSGPTYAATGGVVYTVFQLGCAGILILVGLVILVLMGAGVFRA
jgi:hypothetical protein